VKIRGLQRIVNLFYF